MEAQSLGRGEAVRGGKEGCMDACSEAERGDGGPAHLAAGWECGLDGKLKLRPRLRTEVGNADYGFGWSMEIGGRRETNGSGVITGAE